MFTVKLYNYKLNYTTKWINASLNDQSQGFLLRRYNGAAPFALLRSNWTNSDSVMSNMWLQHIVSFSGNPTKCWTHSNTILMSLLPKSLLIGQQHSVTELRLRGFSASQTCQTEAFWQFNWNCIHSQCKHRLPLMLGVFLCILPM